MGIKALQKWLSEPVNNASLAVFRILWGLLLFGGLLRFWAKGWIADFYLTPSYHFTYLGFDWVTPWPAWGLYLQVALMMGAALMISAGWFYRSAAGFFCVGWWYLELLDKTYYLNHYYAIGLTALWVWLSPLDERWSVTGSRAHHVPRLYLFAFQLQLALIYFFAGLAKLNADWLLQGQPLTTWLHAHSGLPIVGPLMTLPILAYAMAWVGAMFDLTIGLWLWSRWRYWAYGVLAVFHVLTALLFPIGLFPWVMMLLTTLFWAPNWPERVLKFQRTHSEQPSLRLNRFIWPIFCAYFALQMLSPMRFLLYPGNVLWHEQGFRFAWRVMLMEKTGWVTYRVHSLQGGQKVQTQVDLGRYLTPLQIKMLSTQPDMILQFAHHLGVLFRQKGHQEVQIFAEAYAALNGRPSQYLLNPHQDLTKVSRWEGPEIVPLN